MRMRQNAQTYASGFVSSRKEELSGERSRKRRDEGLGPAVSGFRETSPCPRVEGWPSAMMAIAVANIYYSVLHARSDPPLHSREPCALDSHLVVRKPSLAEME